MSSSIASRSLLFTIYDRAFTLNFPSHSYCFCAFTSRIFESNIGYAKADYKKISCMVKSCEIDGISSTREINKKKPFT